MRLFIDKDNSFSVYLVDDHGEPELLFVAESYKMAHGLCDIIQELERYSLPMRQEVIKVLSRVLGEMSQKEENDHLQV